jgi:Lrp/AsnC family leucine-responsive transcriptional regulator
MDAIDREILSVLEKNARMPYKDISERVGLSANAVAERVRKLELNGTIRLFRTEIDWAAFGLPLRALIEVKMESTTTAAEFEVRVAATSGVVRALVTTGRYDWVLEVVAVDQHDLQRIIEALRAGGLARDTYSRIVARDSQFEVLKPSRQL